MIVTKRPFKIPKHKYWAVIEDKYLVDYSEDVKRDMEEELQKLANSQANMKQDMMRVDWRTQHYLGEDRGGADFTED